MLLFDSTDAEQVAAHERQLIEAGQMRQVLLHSCDLVIGVVDVDASSLAARCAPRRLRRHTLGIFISPLSSHGTAAASALTSSRSVPRSRE